MRSGRNFLFPSYISGCNLLCSFFYKDEFFCMISCFSVAHILSDMRSGHLFYFSYICGCIHLCSFFDMDEPIYKFSCFSCSICIHAYKCSKIQILFPFSCKNGCILLFLFCKDEVLYKFSYFSGSI